MKTLAIAAALATFPYTPLPEKAKDPMYNLNFPHVANQLLVGFDAGIKSADAKAVLERQGGKVIHTFANGARLVEFAGKGDRDDLLKRARSLVAAKSVRYVEANTIITIDATLPNDPSFGELYGLHNEGGTGGTTDADIDAPEAWDVTTGSRDVVVGVIDTGIDYTHPDIAPNYWRNPGETGTDANGADKSTNGIDDDGNGYIDDFRGWDFVNNDNDPMDDHNHGTHCAGTIGAHGNDGTGVAGVNWQVSMVGIKFLSGSGSGTLADAVKSIEYATGLGLTMTSNSWGGGGYSDTMHAAINAANDAGILFVAAAGNSSANNDLSPHYPSSYDSANVVSVAALDHSDGLASFSCFGLTSVDLGAPGVDILSTVKAGGYTKYSGTSMATPHVAGVAALVKSAYPDATAAQIKARLMNTADPVASLNGKSVTGGRVNAFNALENDMVPPNAATDISVVSAGTTFVNFSWTAAGDDGNQGQARRYEVRTSSQPIDSDQAWAAAVPADVVISQATDSATVEARITGLAFNSAGYIAVKATDNVGNTGPLSDTVPFAVTQVQKIAEHRAESMDGVTADAPWGVESDASRNGNVFSDSPGADYANDLNVAATLDAVAVASTDLTLVFNAAWNFESGYDFGYVEVSGDNGATWVELDKVTGATSWTQKSYSLAGKIDGAQSVTVRFRVTSDYSIVKDGWKIDDVMIFAPQTN